MKAEQTEGYLSITRLAKHFISAGSACCPQYRTKIQSIIQYKIKNGKMLLTLIEWDERDNELYVNVDRVLLLMTQ